MKQTERQTFEQLCSLRQSNVLHLMRKYLTAKYDKVIATSSYLVAIGNIPVALVAHSDTVFKQPPSEIFYDQEKGVMWSPDGLGADDRAGIFAIMKIIACGQRPHIIITTDEELGCVGASKLAEQMPKFPAPLKFMIQLDRRGKDDAVYYDCDNKEFENFITPFGFKTQTGSYTDISILAPTWKVAAVNFSVGYEDEHSFTERLSVKDLFNTIHKTQKILTKVSEDESIPTFEYIEAVTNYNYSWFDDGYNLFHTIGPGEVHCQFCGDVDKEENFLPLKWHSFNAPNMFICNACYAHSVNEIEWCSKCNTGYFLTKKDLENMPQDRTQWVCKYC